MYEAELVNEGLALMVFGMGFVFVFLTILVASTGLMSRLIQAFVTEQPPVPARSQAPVVHSVSDPASDPLLVAIISDAVKQHRKKQQS